MRTKESKLEVIIEAVVEATVAERYFAWMKLAEQGRFKRNDELHTL